jgi:signal transduction histidine kinase
VTKAASRSELRFQGVRSRMLLMLAVLSLPLLIISLLQLYYYRAALDERTSEIAGSQANAAAVGLAAWLESHPAHASQSGSLSYNDSLDLFQRLEQVAETSGTTLSVIDAGGNVIGNPLHPGIVPGAQSTGDSIAKQRWRDGVQRVTSVKSLSPYGWRVVVGVPVAKVTSGYSLAALAGTWALVLISTILLGVWAVGRFTKPLRHLAASVATLGTGKLDERVPIETDDEVGLLAADFNAMASELEGKFGELREQSRFTEEVLDSLPLGVVVVDPNLIVCKLNPTFGHFVGRDSKTLRRKGLYEAAAGLAKISDVVEDVRRTRKPFVSFGLPLELLPHDSENPAGADTARFWDVTIWPTSVSNARRGDLIIVLSDVTKRVRAEKLSTGAFASEKMRAVQLQGVINQMNEGVIIIDRQMRYKINPAAAKIIGRAPGEFPDGAHAFCEELTLRDMNGRQLAAEETPFWRALEHRQQIDGEQFKMMHPDREPRVLSISAAPLNAEDGKGEGAVAVFRDITKEVHQRDELVNAYDRLRDHDRLKSAFVSNVTHELRTPLNVIIGLCQLLERDPQLPLAMLQKDAVQRMDRNARALLEMVNELLEYSRLEAGRAALHLGFVDINEVVEGVITEYAGEAASKGIELCADVSPDLDKVVTDRGKLSQVLSNLVGNALKFTGTGSVVITASPDGVDRWTLEIKDTGIGMPREALGYIFDEFRQIDDRLTRSYGGTGLGLAITRKLVELLEGEMTVESKPNEGSRFCIVWPRTSRQHTGTGSLVEHNSRAAEASPHLRLRVR